MGAILQTANQSISKYTQDYNPYPGKKSLDWGDIAPIIQYLNNLGIDVSAVNNAIPSMLPPSGPAGGNLSGSYPDPEVIKIRNNTIPSDSPGYLRNDGQGDLTWSLVSAFKYKGVSATYSILITDCIIECTANTFTATLPTAIGITGQMFIVKNSGAGTITLATTSAQTIDGSSTASLTTLQSVRVISNGVNYIVV